MLSTIILQTASALAWVVYGSFYEWFFHKYWMHQPRPPKEAFRGHTIVHHGLYKGDESYFVGKDQKPERILLKPYALPLIVLMHLPVLWLIERYLVAHTMIGGLIAVVCYFVIYEYMHWNMHVPRGHFVERFGWFKFLREHHHIHHRYFMKNFCVLFPLADVVFGTLETRESLAKKKAEREQAIAEGKTASRKTPARAAGRTRPGDSETAGRPLNMVERYKKWSMARNHAMWQKEREALEVRKQRRNA